jgi:hypothetical protein
LLNSPQLHPKRDSIHEHQKTSSLPYDILPLMDIIVCAVTSADRKKVFCEFITQVIAHSAGPLPEQ